MLRYHALKSTFAYVCTCSCFFEISQSSSIRSLPFVQLTYVSRIQLLLFKSGANNRTVRKSDLSVSPLLWNWWGNVQEKKFGVTVRGSIRELAPAEMLPRSVSNWWTSLKSRKTTRKIEVTRLLKSKPQTAMLISVRKNDSFLGTKDTIFLSTD